MLTLTQLPFLHTALLEVLETANLPLSLRLCLATRQGFVTLTLAWSKPLALPRAAVFLRERALLHLLVTR